MSLSRGEGSENPLDIQACYEYGDRVFPVQIVRAGKRVSEQSFVLCNDCSICALDRGVTRTSFILCFPTTRTGTSICICSATTSCYIKVTIPSGRSISVASQKELPRRKNPARSNNLAFDFLKKIISQKRHQDMNFHV